MPRPLASARWRIVLDQPSPAARPGRRVRGSCGTRPLRQNYITPHCSQCPPVSRKLLLWQPPLCALWVKATGVMQNCLRWSGRTAVGASRSVPALRAAVCAPLWLSWHLGIGKALRAVLGQWPAASYLVCAPPTLWPRRCAALALRWYARPPQRGSLSPRAFVFGSATSLVAVHARNTGATGLTACKPAWPLAYFSSAIAPACAMYLIAACARSMRARALFGI